MGTQDTTMQSPISHKVSLFLCIAGIFVAGVLHVFRADIPNIYSLSLRLHGIAFAITFFLVITWQHAPSFVKWLTWTTLLYTMAYVTVVICLIRK
jgi:hypothetical protein